MNAGYFYCPYIPLDHKKVMKDRKKIRYEQKDMNEHLELVENLECTVIENAPVPEIIALPFPAYQSKLLREELEEMRGRLKEEQDTRRWAEAAATRMSVELEALKANNPLPGQPPADLEVRLYEEYDKKVKDIREFMINSVDKFFKYKLEEYQGNVEAMVANTTPEKFFEEAVKS